VLIQHTYFYTLPKQNDDLRSCPSCVLKLIVVHFPLCLRNNIRISDANSIVTLNHFGLGLTGYFRLVSMLKHIGLFYSCVCVIITKKHKSTVK
jgi:hypothetical protein